MLEAVFSSQNNPSDPHVEQFRQIIQGLDVKLLDVKYEVSQVLTEQTKRQLERLVFRCNLVVSFRGVKQNILYLNEEISLAKKCSKPIVIISRDGILSGGNFVNIDFISLKEGELEAVPRIIEAIKNIKQSSSFPKEPILSYDHFEEVLMVLDLAVLHKENRRLTDNEVQILRGSWQGKSYKHIALTCGLQPDSITNGAGPKLWKLLSDVLGEEVGKKSFQAALERLWRLQGY